MHQKVVEMVKELSEGISFEDDSDLFVKGIIDSFAVVSMVAEIENEFNIELEAEDIIPENFQTINAITKLIEKKLNNI
jgi:acyl carrier protein